MLRQKRLKMGYVRVSNVIDCYSVRAVVGGVPYIPGSTLQDKTKYLEHNPDYIRTSIIQRGSHGERLPF
jgi:proline racemase